MDWQYRKYYLVVIRNYHDDNVTHEIYKTIAPSLRIHSPYNHFIISPEKKKEKNIYSWNRANNWDAWHFDITGMRYVQEMLSCKINESKELETELSKSSNFVEITKEMCGQ